MKNILSERRNEFHYIAKYMDRDSSVGIATHYGLNGPGIEPRWGGREFLYPYRPALGPTQSRIQCVAGLFPGDKAVGASR